MTTRGRTRTRRLGAVATALVMAAATAACSQGSSSTASGDDDSSGDGSALTLNGERADFVEAYEVAGEALQELGHPGIEPRNVPSTENYQQVIRSSLQTDSVTDLIKWWNGYRLQELAQSGGLADLTSVWEEAEDQGWVNPETRDSFSYDGAVYGVPMYKSYWVIFYNKHVFADLNLEPPTTWQEFMDNNATIRDAGITPLFATQEAGWTSSIWFGELLSKVDPDFYTRLMNGEASYTDEPAQEAMRLWSQMYAEDFFTAPDVAWDNEPALLQEGSVAQVPMGTWRNGIFAENGMTEDDYGAYLLPTVNPDVDPSVVVESGVISVAERAPNRDAAVDAMGDWLNPDVQEEWTEMIKDTSANPEVAIDDPLLTSVTDQVSDQAPAELVRYWEASPPALIQGGVQHLGAFMVDPTEENIMPTLEALQALAEDEWANWENAG